MNRDSIPCSPIHHSDDLLPNRCPPAIRVLPPTGDGGASQPLISSLEYHSPLLWLWTPSLPPASSVPGERSALVPQSLGVTANLQGSASKTVSPQPPSPPSHSKFPETWAPAPPVADSPSPSPSSISGLNNFTKFQQFILQSLQSPATLSSFSNDAPPVDAHVSNSPGNTDKHSLNVRADIPPLLAVCSYDGLPPNSAVDSHGFADWECTAVPILHSSPPELVPGFEFLSSFSLPNFPFANLPSIHAFAAHVDSSASPWVAGVGSSSDFQRFLLQSLQFPAPLEQTPTDDPPGARKMKRKKHYTLEQKLALLWEKMRRRNITKEDRSKLVSEALKKMQGKISEIASSHVSSRVLRTCVKHCTQEERNVVFMELRPHFISLASNTYAVHLVTKILDHAPKEQLAEFISSLHGHVASLLRQMVGSLVIEHAYSLGNASQKQALLIELYSPELQLFKDLVTMKESRLEDIIPKLQLQKSSVLRHMSSVLQPILEKGILDHSIVHRALMEYLNITDKSSAADVIEQLSGPSLVRMIHTKDGSRLGMLCIRHGSAKERKKIIKGMKDHAEKIARDKFGSAVLVCLLSVVDDTKLLSKIILRELERNLKELILDQNARRPFLQLLHPDNPRYLSPDDLESLSLSIPCLKNKAGSDAGETVEEDKGSDGDHSDGNIQLSEGGKKDAFKRRQELLVNSGLAEKLIDACSESAEALLRSKYGKEVIYEVAAGGADGILHPTLDEKLHELHEAIASLAAQPKPDNEEEEEEEEKEKEEHILEQFHSSRVIRKLVLDCPSFASTLWEKALKGNCAIWAKGHSCKVIDAFLETSNSDVKELAKEELQPLIESGDLSLPKSSESTNQ